MTDKPTLKDVVNYDWETYITPDEKKMVRGIMKSSPDFLNLLRKVFVPSASDHTLPLEEILQNDPWMQGRDWGAIPNEEIKSIVLARQEALKFVMGGLIRLKVMASEEEETEAEKEERVKKDSVE